MGDSQNTEQNLLKINDPKLTELALEKLGKAGVFQAKISAKIKEVFSEMLDEDVLDALVKKEIDEYFTQEHQYHLDSIKVFSKTHNVVPSDWERTDWRAKEIMLKEHGPITEVRFLNRKVTQFRQDIWSIVQPHVISYVKTQLEKKDSEITKEIDQQLKGKREEILQGKVSLTVGLAGLMSQGLIDAALRTANEQASAMLNTTVSGLPYDKVFVNNLTSMMQSR